MNIDDYFWKTKKRPIKTKPRAKPLPKAKDAYLEAEEEFEHALNVLGIISLNRPNIGVLIFT